MADPITPDPTAVRRGAVVLTNALRISTLLPHEQDVIFSILRSLRSADELLLGLAGHPDVDAYAARLLDMIVDNYRRKLSDLGRWGESR